MTHLRTLRLFVLGLAAAACSSPDQSPQGQAIPVRTITVAEADIDNVLELPGRVEPVRTAEVRARVTGIVQARLYEEGTDIRAGQPLFRIDPRELRASYAQTQAALTRARAAPPRAGGGTASPLSPSQRLPQGLMASSSNSIPIPTRHCAMGQAACRSPRPRACCVR